MSVHSLTTRLSSYPCKYGENNQYYTTAQKNKARPSTTALQWRHGISIHRHVDCALKSLLRATAKAADNWSFVWESSGDQWIHFTKGHQHRKSLRWRHNESDGSQISGVSIVFLTVCSGRSKKISKLCVTGLCEGNPPMTGGFPSRGKCFQLMTSSCVSKSTHRGRVTHICVGKPTINGSDNGLSPERRQAIIWINVGILIIGPVGTNFNEFLIVIHISSFNKMHLKMPSAKWRPFCLGLNVSIQKMSPVQWTACPAKVYSATLTGHALAPPHLQPCEPLVWQEQRSRVTIIWYNW